ncbi:hypothetical protein SFIMM107S_05409 [Streptomyces griseus]
MLRGPRGLGGRFSGRRSVRGPVVTGSVLKRRTGWMRRGGVAVVCGASCDHRFRPQAPDGLGVCRAAGCAVGGVAGVCGASCDRRVRPQAPDGLGVCGRLGAPWVGLPGRAGPRAIAGSVLKRRTGWVCAGRAGCVPGGLEWAPGARTAGVGAYVRKPRSADLGRSASGASGSCLGAPHPRGERRFGVRRGVPGRGGREGPLVRSGDHISELREEAQACRAATLDASADFLLAAAFLWMTPFETALSS